MAKETVEQLVNKIAIKEAELREVEMQAQGYWDLVGDVRYASQSANSKTALAEAKRLSKQVNSRRATILKLKQKLKEITG